MNIVSIGSYNDLVWYQAHDKPLSEQMLAQFTDAFVTQPQ